MIVMSDQQTATGTKIGSNNVEEKYCWDCSDGKTIITCSHLMYGFTTGDFYPKGKKTEVRIAKKAAPKKS